MGPGQPPLIVDTGTVSAGFTPLSMDGGHKVQMAAYGAGFTELLPEPSNEDGNWGMQQSKKMLDNTELSDAMWQRMQSAGVGGNDTNTVSFNARGTSQFGY